MDNKYCCDRCGGPTETRMKPYKAPRQGTWPCTTCTNGCMDGKWPHTVDTRGIRSAIPVQDVGPHTVSKTSGNGCGENTELLRKILAALERIEVIAANPGKVNIAKSEMEPDSDSPF